MMELKDTIPLMTSDDYRDRLKAEYQQTVIRAVKLSKALEENKFPMAIQIVAQTQLNHMLSYIAVLSYRAQMENIDLED